MYTESVQISELIPDTFVRVVLNNGKHKYGYMLNTSKEADDHTVVVAMQSPFDSFNEVVFEKLDTRSIVSIDPFMK